MKDATLPLKIIFHYLVLYLTFFSYFYSPAFLQAACDCIDPGLGDCSSLTPGDPCPRQPGTGCADTPANQYFLRYSVTAEHGFMTFIGNSLGLNKAPCVNDVGSIPGNITHSIGAFITTDPTQQVGSYAHILNGDTGGPAYTTLDWTKNRSTAELHLPAGAVILYAELIWCGSYGFYCGNPNVGSTYGVCVECILNYADGPIVFITPDNVTHSVTADPTTAIKSQNSVSSLDYCAGHYVRTQNVTAILTVLADHNGTYTVGNVPATISPFENSSNGAGWTLAIVYHDPSTTNVNNMTLFVGGQASSLSATPAEITGFCAQYDPDPSKRLPARLLVSAIEGDPNLTGDQMQFGPTPATLQPLSGPNNPIGDFFCSQINDDNGNLINTTGTFCTYNSTTSTLLPNGRQGYDITNVDCSGTIVPGQTTAYAVGTTTGDNYVINALGLQLSVYAPYMTATKAVDSDCAKHDDTVTFTITIENSGTLDASDLVLTDVLELGLTFVPNSVYVNSGNVPGADPNVGVPMGALAQGDTTEVTFDAQITGLPLSGNQFVNRGTVSFDYIPACGGDPVTEDTDTNEVFITLDSPAVLTAAKLINGVLDYCAAPGETVTISISVENTGPIDTTGLVLTDILESGLTFVPNSVYVNSVNIPGANPNAGVSLGTLAQGNTTVVTFQAHNVSLPPSGNQFLNTGSVSFDYVPLCSGVTPVPGSTDTNDSYITLNFPAVLTASKLVNGVLDYCAVPGETVTISVSVENTGRLDTTDLVLTDILESGLTFVADSVYVNSVNVPGADPSAGIPLGDLAQDNTTVVTFQAQNVSLPPSGNQFVNSATIFYLYIPACGGVSPLPGSADTNEAFITLDSPAVLTSTLYNFAINSLTLVDRKILQEKN